MNKDLKQALMRQNIDVDLPKEYLHISWDDLNTTLKPYLKKVR